MTAGTGAVKITIVVDNRAEQGLLCEHGLSAWIEVAGRRLLFDTGQGMDELQELGPDLIVPCHCTGDAAVERLGKTFGERVVPGAAGAVFRLGGATASEMKEQTQ